MIILDTLDIFTMLFLIGTSVYTWKIHKLVPAKQVSWLLGGFIGMTLASIGFILINYLPFDTLGDIQTNRLIAELSVAIRVIPMFCIFFGMFWLHKAIIEIIARKSK